MTVSSAIPNLDAPTRLLMPRKAGAEADAFRSMLDRATPSARKLEREAADPEAGAQLLVEPAAIAADEDAPAADETEAGSGEEPTTAKTSDDKAETDPDALPHSARAIEDLRLMLAGSAQTTPKDGAGGASPQEPVPADADQAADADTIKSKVIETPAAPAAATPGTPAATARPSPANPAAPDTAQTARPVASPATADGAAKPTPATPAAPETTQTAGGPAAPQATANAVDTPALRPARADDRNGGGDSRQGDNRRGQGDGKPLPGVTVVTDGAPSPQPAPQPAARAVVATLGADPAWAAYFRAKPAPAAQPAPQSLTIQLRPVELGVVTAHLRFAGERVAVELQAETAEARQQLSADTDLIARSLRAAGLEVDQVTVQPAPQAQDAGRGALPGRGEGASGGGAAFASQEGGSERGGSQGNSNGSQGFLGHNGGDEIRTGAGGADRDGRYI